MKLEKMSTMNRTSPSTWLFTVALLMFVSLLALGCDRSSPEKPEATAAFTPVETVTEATVPDESGPELEVGQKAGDDEAPEATEEVEEVETAEPDEPEAAEPEPPRLEKPAPKPKPKPTAKRQEWKAAVLQVVTNFEKADVTVNGLKYPEYFEPGAPEGMVLPAGGPYTVLVTFGGKAKEYRIHLRPYETRLLIVELSGYQAGAPPPPKPAAKVQKQEKQEQKKKAEKPDPKAPGRITVYSKPGGTVIVDGNATGEKTPGTVELENGRHEVQVQYETGSTSEKKIVRVRTGSRIKLFFRERNSK